MIITNDMWQEQDAYNRLVRDTPETESAVAEFLRDMSINMMSEMDELLRTTTWKKHRRVRSHRPNRDHRLEEVVDLLKLWMTIVQGLGYTPDELAQAFWRKSMVCRQRWSEEWVIELNAPAVVVDIDNVLCDYTAGFCDWIANRAPMCAAFAQEIKKHRRWVHRASQFGFTETEWQGFKHEFRSLGGKRHLPVIAGSRAFLERIKAAGYLIILLTSRPIDRYPNIYTDTLDWLKQNKMPYDFVWWSTQKGERLIESQSLSNIKLVVDDDWAYVQQFLRVGLETYYYAPGPDAFLPREWDLGNRPPHLHVVRSFDEIELPPLQSTESVTHGV